MAAVGTATWHGTYDGIIGREAVEERVAEWYDPETVRGYFEDEEFGAYVATRDGDVVGYAYSRPAGETGVWYLPAVYVHPDAQGEGFGSALLARVERDARGGRRLGRPAGRACGQRLRARLLRDARLRTGGRARRPDGRRNARTRVQDVTSRIRSGMNAANVARVGFTLSGLVWRSLFHPLGDRFQFRRAGDLSDGQSDSDAHEQYDE